MLDCPPEPVFTPRLPVNIVDHFAATEPDRPYAYAPVTDDPEDGFAPILFGALARAVNHVAHDIAALRSRVPEATTDDFPTVAYLGPNDVRYLIIMLACVKARCKAFFASPRNSDASMQSLLGVTKPIVILHADRFADLARHWASIYPVELRQAPSSHVWLEASPMPFPYEERLEEARWHPYFVIHTSGSTGIPKPVVVKQGSFSACDIWRQQPEFQGAPFLFTHWAASSSRLLLPMPAFHMAALSLFTFLGLYSATPIVFAPPDRPLTADIVLRCIMASESDSAMLPPSVLQEIAAIPGGIEVLARLKFLGYGGGPVAPPLGDMLVERGVKLASALSSTEFSPYHIFYQRDPKLWNWHILNTDSMGAEMREIDARVEGERAYELVLRRMNKDPGLQTVFYTFPDKQEWATGDLFKKHPTLPHHYQYAGRADDVIIFSNGLKMNPSSVERLVACHPGVKNALVVGSGRFQPALIVEPHVLPQSSEQAEALIDSLWPTIEEANQTNAAHSKITRQLVTISDPKIPFPTSAKGSVQRPFANEIYKHIIDAVYEKAEEQHDDEQEAQKMDFESIETLTASITEILVTRLGVSGVTPDADLFSLGVDSLRVVSLSKHIFLGAKAAGFDVDYETVSPRVIYAQMAPRALAEHLLSRLSGGDDTCALQRNDVHEMGAFTRLVEKYTSDLPPPNKGQQEPLNDDQTIIITGTTGSLGAYMLDRLVRSSRVRTIIALNRGDDGGASRQVDISADRGLSTDFSKVEFLGGDLSLPTWGFGKEIYEKLLASADRIVHSAWPVNFNIGVGSFEPSIRGVRHLVDFSNRAAKRVPIVFVSSISTAMRWRDKAAVPEERLDDPSLPKMGYGRSKAAASMILEAAVAKSGVCAASIRVGVIAGSHKPSGMWNKQDFIPSLVASSVYLGILPDSIGSTDAIDWMPAEDVAGLVLDVSGISEPRSVSDISGYFHGVNPRTTTWSSIASAIKEYYGKRIAKIVSLAEWVDALERSAQETSAGDAERNPGIKLIDTYKTMLASREMGLQRLSFATERTEAHSRTLRNTKPVSGDLMKLWCSQWNY
ncbi:Carboxylic acid reductase [Escovopsis weberi]|uniref:Carboxylic acid reductase n=1 Tax=Escovopsis weberi TaxID=150374 RepID=A0A0M9VSH8_ESCWE|nr:Carboxylic acid reductase [Escovopsis weberi]